MSKVKYKPKPQDIVLDFLTDNDRIKDILYVESMDTLYVWQGGWYQEVNEKKMVREIYQFCLAEHDDMKLTEGFIKDLFKQVKWQIAFREEELSKKYICFRDCLLNTETWETEKHSRTKISTFYLPYKYADLPDEHPNWDKFLSTSLVDKDNIKKSDTELTAVVQEMFGDFLMPNLNSATAYFLVGGGANGKSVMLDLATHIIGEEFISAMNIEMLTTDKFSLPHLIGKRVNLSNEEESKYIKSDKFKALITGDAVSAERKYGDRFTFRPTAKFVFASNKIPTFSDLNYGIMRRIKIVPFNQRFDRDNPLTDKNIFEKLKGEAPAIIKWAVQGAKRLVENNYEHTHSAQSNLAMEDFQGDISSAVLFFREHYIVTPENGWISNAELYAHYKQWCEENGKKPFSSQNFGRDLVTAFPDIKTKNGRDSSNNVASGKTVQRRNFEDEFAGVEGANTGGIDIDDIPI